MFCLVLMLWILLCVCFRGLCVRACVRVCVRVYVCVCFFFPRVRVYEV